jgi:hypothetical protein
MDRAAPAPFHPHIASFAAPPRADPSPPNSHGEAPTPAMNRATPAGRAAHGAHG